MKSVLKKVAVAALLLGTASSAFAVDGYKDLKFGMNKDQVAATNLCSFGEYAESNGMGYMECDDLTFNGGTTFGAAWFINGKLSRFAIVLADDELVSVATALKNKFGAPTKRSSPKSVWRKVDVTPNTEANMWFDNNTVLLAVVSGQDLTKTNLLAYTEADFNNRISKMESQSIASDL
ncbi:hypothetical protein [Photobacterium leiognathi]|uniref:hypothetical protein n=1 Tax=Photobacterium leiognathi TaxID=553611 RepID=UPI0027383B16|nr:hypothetical protein [Photobacterium leiognathi]